MTDVADLIAKARIKEHGNRCWRRRLDGKAKEFIEAVESAGVSEFTWTGISRVLNDDCGANVGPKSVGEHYRGGCSCPR